MKESLKKIPVLGETGRNVAKVLKKTSRTLRGKNTGSKYNYKRIELNDNEQNEYDRETTQIVNLLSYTKTSGQAYNAEIFPAGYHSFNINGFELKGQRNPQERINAVPYDFTGKTVLDIGCNQGGMLYSVADKIAHGTGIDFDYRLINAANKVRSHTKQQNLDFFVFDLEKENLELIRDLIPAEKVDIVFLLSVCMWIENWHDVINLSSAISDTMLFESNGTEEQQKEQLDYLGTIYKKIELITEKSEDDEGQKNRKLYLCS
jgi:2-polyprenyl-3-methyl-5-hydroxy-6-metoxy-1,4-benzoquinol methylase